MALSSYGTPMGKVLGIRGDMKGWWGGGTGSQTDRQTEEVKRQRKAEEGEVWKRLPRVNICQSWFDFVCLGVCALARKTVSCERRSLLVRGFLFFFSVFCCSFSEIYTVGLNPVLHQHSGSAYSNTRADQHTHTPKIIPLMDFVIVIQSRNLRGFYLFLGYVFRC